MAPQGWTLAAPRHVIETAGRGPELYDGVLPTEAGDGDQLGVSFRSPFAGARSLGRAAGAQAACDLIRHMKDARRSGEGLALIPLTNRRNRPRRKWTPVARRGPAACGLRLGNAKALAQRPAKRRGFRRWPAARPISLCTRRLVGGAGSPARTRLFAPISLIYGKIQGIRTNSGSAGLAISPDSPARAGACTPRSLRSTTGN
jgi:hypothetical protein